MALLTKGQVRTAVLQAIDDPSNKRWSATNIDILISLVQDTMFETINDTFEYFLSNTETKVASAGGVVTIASLTKRFYRLQKLTIQSSSAELQPKLFVESVPQASYYLLGDNIMTDPSVGAVSLNVAYSYLPTKFMDLATDATVLTDYPEGHEAALIYLAATWAMTKGDAESMQQIGRIADQAVEAMLVHIARRYPIGASNRIAAVKASIMRNPVLVGQQA